jgi:NAD(P)-dependent dehydrogenase (short-subunit alcohol dehydrogenase family)
MRANPRRLVQENVRGGVFRDLVSIDQNTYPKRSRSLFMARSRLDTYKINTASYHFTAFAFLPLLCAAKSIGGAPEPGNIITIASMSGITLTSQRGQFNYNASKAATISLALQQATEFARRNLGVRVNIINPGYFPSGMTIVETKDDQSSEQLFDHFRKEWGVPFGRPGNAVDYAQTILSIARVR